MSDLVGQVAVITGGAGGIGMALAQHLGNRGAAIVIADLQDGAVQEAVLRLQALNIEALGVTCDVTDAKSVERLAKRAFDWKGRADLLINNAGISQQSAKLHQADIADAKRVMDVNFWGVWHGCAAFGPLMADQSHPSAIYNVGSENSLFCAVPRSAAYIASKHAVLGLTESFREDMPDHVHVGTIMPGWVTSGLSAKEVAHLAMPAAEFADIVVPQMLARERFVVSHPYNVVRKEQRDQAIADSYARNAPRQDGDEAHDVRLLIAKMRSG